MKLPFTTKNQAGQIRAKTLEKGVLLRVNNLSKHIHNLVIIDGVSFEVKTGEHLALIGGNGAGKTTLVEMIAGLTRPSSGEITYGFPYKVSPKESIGMQFQKVDYPSGLTVADMIKFALNIRKLKLKPKELNHLLKIFQMEDFYRKVARNLSGGQKQKLNILMAVLHRPRLLILDELSTGLDISARTEIIAFMKRILREHGHTAIFISHHFHELEEICANVITLAHGKITAKHTMQEIVTEHGSLENYAKSVIK